MNSIVCNRALPQLRLLYQFRRAGYWNKDWKPGPCPEMPEQHKAAAKKYNLLPEEYEPFPKGNGLREVGDYPNLPDVSVENKDIFYPWDFPEERRNYGEPLHINAVWYNEDRVDSHGDEKFKYTPLQMFSAMAGSVLLIFVVALLPPRCFPPVAARHMPKPGTVHYSYEKPTF